MLASSEYLTWERQLALAASVGFLSLWRRKCGHLSLVVATIHVATGSVEEERLGSHTHLSSVRSQHGLAPHCVSGSWLQ